MFICFSVLAVVKFLPEMGVFPFSDIHYAAELGNIKSVDREVGRPRPLLLPEAGGGAVEK